MKVLAGVTRRKKIEKNKITFRQHSSYSSELQREKEGKGERRIVEETERIGDRTT